MKPFSFLITLIISNFLTFNAMARGIQQYSTAFDNTWIATVSVGPLLTKSSNNQTLFLTPEIERAYSATRTNNTLVSGGLFLGLQKILSSQWLGQLGVAFAASTKATLRGEIWEEADPQFDNYTYQYKVQNNRLALLGKLLLNKNYRLMPWVSGSIGVGFNRAYAFTNTPLIYEAVPTDNFRSHTLQALTYSLGVGVQKEIKQHWQVGVGYEFIDWGRSQLGRTICQTINLGPQLNHLYTNGILFNLTYSA